MQVGNSPLVRNSVLELAGVFVLGQAPIVREAAPATCDGHGGEPSLVFRFHE